MRGFLSLDRLDCLIRECGKAHVVCSTCENFESMPLAGLLSLLNDGLLDGHVYPVRTWAQINQKLIVLAQTPFHQWAPKPRKPFQFRTSSSECLFSEGQTQARQRFYNGSVKRRRAPKFTGEGRRYVVQTFVRESDLTAESHQVTLDPSMEVSDH
jgi:hypothetical protein